MPPRSPHTRVIGTVLAILAAVIVVVPGSPAGATDVAQSVIVSDNPSNFTPNVLDGQVNAILPVGNRIIAAGAFSQVQASSGGATLTRNNIFAFDASSGTIDTSFVPSVNGEIKALALGPDGGIFIGGSFSTVNGVTAQRLVKLNATTGQQITAFAALPSGMIRDLEVRGQTLYVGGVFTTIKGQSRQNLAALDTTTGAVSPNLNLPLTDSRKAGVNPSLYKLEVSPDGTKMVVIGNFTKINGLTRWQAGMIDLSTTPATVRNWATDRFTPPCAINAFDTYMRDVAFAPDGSYFAIVSTGAYSAGTLCDTTSRWPTNATGTALQPTWVSYTGGDTLYSVAITGTAIYVGGHQRWVNNPFAGDQAGPGAVPREGIAALDPINGLPFTWDPGRTRGVGVFDMVATSNGLWVGSDTDQIGGETHRKLAFFPTAGGTTVPSTAPYTLPGDLYNVQTDLPPAPAPGPIGFLTRRSFNGTTLGVSNNLATPGIDWRGLRGMFALQGTLYYGLSNGTFNARSFNGTTVGAQQQIDLHGLTNFPVQSITGMFYANGGIYYTVQNDAQMYFRGFTPESRVVGAERFAVSGNGDGLNWSTTRGLTMANGTIYFSRTDNNLSSMSFANNDPVPGTEALVSPAGGGGTNWASGGLFVFSAAALDTTPPTVPGQPTGQSSVPGAISITWAASTDDSPPITYQVYRDGGGASIGSTTSTSFTDTGLTPGSSHTYRVDATDSQGNSSAMSPASAPITVASGQSAIFADDFSAAFANWSGVTNLSIDNTTGGVAPPSARGQLTSQTGFAFKDLGGSFNDVCMSAAVNVPSIASSTAALLRLRTAASGNIVRVYANQAGVLYVKADVGGTQKWSGVAIGGGWHTIELCGTVGTSTTWDLSRDGAIIVNDWAANTGTTGVGRVEIGDNTAKTWTVNFDDVVVDQTPG
jgi:hypothetical protein